MLEDLPNDDKEKDYFDTINMVERNTNVEIFHGEKASSIVSEETKLQKEDNSDS